MANLNPDLEKQRQQYLNIRGAQMAENQTKCAPPKQKKGSKKQLIGTVVGLLGAVVILVLLAKLQVI